MVTRALAPRNWTRGEDGPDRGLHMSHDDRHDPPGERLGARRGTVTEIVDVAVDRAWMIGLEGCHVRLNLVQPGGLAHWTLVP